MMERLVHWLTQTRASSIVQHTGWIIPATQSVHILAVAVVMSCMVLLNLRMAGVLARDVGAGAFSRRYSLGLWISLPILVLTGATLIVGEPGRDLNTWVFWLKMGLLLGAVVITLGILTPLRRDDGFWDVNLGRRVTVRAFAWTGLLLWAAVVFCGRWIAYVYAP